MRDSRDKIRVEAGRNLTVSRRSLFVFRAGAGAGEGGVALISALLLVALATTAAVAMAVRQQIDIRRTTNTLEYDQALLYTQGVEEWAGQILKRDTGNSDSLDEDWAQVLPPIPVDGGQIAGAMEDMQARFNLNSIIDQNGNVVTTALERFQRLLMALQLPVEFSYALADWLDRDDEVRMGGAEQVEYLGLQPPYRAFNGPITSPSELWLVKGMTREIYTKLSPYISALPSSAKLNVSTVPKEKPELIMCLKENISREEALQVLENRGKAGFDSPNEFTGDTILRDRNIPPGDVTVKSDFFMVTSHIQVGRSTFTTYSLLDRRTSPVRTMMRAQGTY